MSDDTRKALGIPKTVQTALGAVEVRTLSVTALMVVTDQIVAIITRIYRTGITEIQLIWDLQQLLSKEPTLLTGMLAKATRLSENDTPLSAEDLGDLPVDQFLDLVIAFMDQHEKSIARFFDLKGRWVDLRGRTQPSRSSSTPSLVPAGPSPISSPSASSSLNVTEGSPQSVESMNASSS